MMLRVPWGECDVPPNYLHEGERVHIAPHTVEGVEVTRDEDVTVEAVSHVCSRCGKILPARVECQCALIGLRKDALFIVHWHDRSGRPGATAYHPWQRLRLYGSAA